MTKSIVAVCAFAIVCAFPARLFAQHLPIPIRQGQPYSKARVALLNNGWQTYENGGIGKGFLSSLQKQLGKSFVKSKYNEYWGCSGTGVNLCYMMFKDANRRLLQVTIVGGMKPDLLSPIQSWELVEEPPRTP